MPLVLPGVETRVINSVDIEPGNNSAWSNITFASPVQQITVWVDCVAESAALKLETSLDGSKWLLTPFANNNTPNYNPFIFYPDLPFGSNWETPTGFCVPINFIPMKRLRIAIGVAPDDSATRTASVWVLAL